MPPRKRAAESTATEAPAADQTNNGVPPAPAGLTPNPHPPFSGPAPTCPKCDQDAIQCEYHPAGTRPGEGDTIIGGAGVGLAYPEWTRRICAVCGYSWPEMCADATEPLAEAIMSLIYQDWAAQEWAGTRCLRDDQQRAILPTIRLFDQAGTMLNPGVHASLETVAEVLHSDSWSRVAKLELAYLDGNTQVASTFIGPDQWNAGSV